MEAIEAKRIVQGIALKLTDKEAEAMWGYLDGEPLAVPNFIELIAKTHRELARRLCQTVTVTRKTK